MNVKISKTKKKTTTIFYWLFPKSVIKKYGQWLAITCEPSGSLEKDLAPVGRHLINSLLDYINSNSFVNKLVSYSSDMNY